VFSACNYEKAKAPTWEGLSQVLKHARSLYASDPERAWMILYAIQRSLHNRPPESVLEGVNRHHLMSHMLSSVIYELTCG